MTVYDAHVHYTFGIPLKKTIEIFKKEFDDTQTEKCVFLSVPVHNYDKRMVIDTAQNVKGLFLKKAFAPNAYAFAGLEHSPTRLSDDERSKSFLSQAKEYHQAGFDGIKMLEGHPLINKLLNTPLNSPVYDAFFNYLERNSIPVTLHLSNPETSWNNYASDVPKKDELTKQVFGVLDKHPDLKLVLAHFGFMSTCIDDAHRFMSYKNTRFDLTPGGEQLIEMQKQWSIWHEFFKKYCNRIIYGTDQYAFYDDDENEWKICFHRRPDFVRKFFETNQTFTYINTTTTGVNLEKNILDKIYRTNLIDYLGEPKKIDVVYLKDKATKLKNKIPDCETFPQKDDDYTARPLDLNQRKQKYIDDLTFILDNL